MTMELLDGEPTQANAEEQAEYISYVRKFAKPDETEEEHILAALKENPSFLKRNRRKPAGEIKKEPDANKPADTEVTKEKGDEETTDVR